MFISKKCKTSWKYLTMKERNMAKCYGLRFCGKDKRW